MSTALLVGHVVRDDNRAEALLTLDTAVTQRPAFTCFDSFALGSGAVDADVGAGARLVALVRAAIALAASGDAAAGLPPVPNFHLRVFGVRTSGLGI